MARTERQRGTLIGLAVGDALGAAVEFEIPGDFEPVTGYRAGGPHGLAPGEWTDDTSMALALADSIAEVGWDINDQAERYLKWWRTGAYSVNGRCFDIGSTTIAALHRFQQSGDARTSGDPSERAAGNGSIMRLAPVPIRYSYMFPDGIGDLVERAIESSLPTHASPQCLSACVYMTVAICGLIDGRSPRPPRHDRARPRRALGRASMTDSPRYTLAATDADPPIDWGYWVVKGQFLAGAYPGSLDPEDHRSKVQTLLDAGIRTFINLTETDERGLGGNPFVPYEPVVEELSEGWAKKPRCARFAIRDQSVPSVEQMTSILDAIDAALEARHPVYVHCWGGVGRTGTVVGCWLLRHQLADTEDVLQVLNCLRLKDQERRHRRSPETPDQGRLVMKWAEGRLRGS